MERTTQTIGYYYFGARYYDAQRSVWLTSDPAVEKFMEGNKEGKGGIYNYANLNTYHYCSNNPIRYVDPTGENQPDMLLPDGRELEYDKINDSVKSYFSSYMKEFFEIYKGTEIGIGIKGGIKIGNYLNTELNATFIGIEWNGSSNDMKQGVSGNFFVGYEDFTLMNSSYSWMRSINDEDGYLTYDVLKNKAFEYNQSNDLSPTYSITIPIPFLSLSIDIKEAGDFVKKVINPSLLKDKK